MTHATGFFFRQQEEDWYLTGQCNEMAEGVQGERNQNWRPANPLLWIGLPLDGKQLPVA